MNIAVIGTGYVGLVTGTCLAHAGHTVTCVDIDEAKVERMQNGVIPIFEPGLEEIFVENLEAKRLTITTDTASAVQQAEVVFLALPTPPGADGSADLSAVLQVASQIGAHLRRYTVIVDKSTVPVGTAEQVIERLEQNASAEFDVVSNPEFLREGFAVEDFMHPDRIVIGADNERSEKVMREVYQSFIELPEQLVCMDIRSAEMTKYAANSFLAVKVSFMNEIANLCEALGANVDNVRRGIGPDQRIGKKFLNAGIGYGGSCFPKDVQALHFTAKQQGYDFKLLESIIQVNTAQKMRLVQKVANYFGGNLSGKHFALWGLAFKPNTDDIREAPSLTIIDALLAQGATVCAYDPEATENVRRYYGDKPGLSYATSSLEAAKGADAVLLVTEWDEFKNPDLDALKEALAEPVFFDGRNIYPLGFIQEAGFYYESIGRPTAPVQNKRV